MDPNKKLLLQKHQQDIIDDLEVAYIYDELFTKNVISAEEFDHILSLTSRVEQARFLLDSLIRTGSNGSYEAFVDSLHKDYKWLWEKLAIENNNPMPNDSFEDSLSKGDVPRLPEHHVRRTKVEQYVADSLKLLARHKVLVLHGMSGSGKTCVVLSALRDNPDLVTNNFNGVVFWANFGNCKTDDDIIFQQSKLLRKASSMYTQHSYMNSSISMSSIGSNGDSQSSSNYEWTMIDLKDKLKAQFSEQPLKECLLVMDDVNDKKCLEAFDIGCKILVTTRDTSVVANYHPQIIKIENSLEEKESLEIFALSLDVLVSQLPWQAKKIHEICKGSPFNIGLIGAQLAENRERLIDDPKRWNYYVKELKKKNHFSFISINQTYNPMKTIEVCINSLNDSVLPLFKKLKILPDNVKVSAKVLSKLWNKEASQVESIMKELRSKSLIIEDYDREQRNYMYEIHDLIMKYLKSTGEDDGKKLHSDFLNSYGYNNSTPPLDIIDDGYIAFYIGYHIKNTDNYNEKWGLFNKLFLNLKFLGNKVRLTGPADVMSDLQNYEANIVKHELDKELIANIKAFLSTHGNDLFHYPCTDIIQSILQNESKGILYSKASQIAQENCNNNELYFDFLHEQNVDEIKPSTIDVKEKITAVCFLRDYVLVGTNSGIIKFFHIFTNKLRKELRGTGSPIKWIGVSCTKNPPIVAALAYDGVIKLWYVDDVECEENDDIIEEEPEEAYNNTYADTEQIQGSYLNCRWSNNEEYLIMHTNKKIIFYNPSRTEKNKIFKTITDFERDREILCCIPCNYDKYVIVATDGNAKCVEVIDLKTKERVITFEETDIVLDMITVPRSNKIITLKPNEIMEHEIRINSNALKSNTCRCRRVIVSDDIKENTYFLAIAVNKTGTLLFVATDDSRVVCIDLKTYTRNFDLDNRRGNVVAMAVTEMMWDEFEPGSDVLLTGTGCIEDSAKVWYLDASYVSQTAQKNGRIRLTTKFDVSFVNPLSPHTPTSSNSGTESANTTPRRHQSFNHREVPVSKAVLKNSMSLDRSSLKPLNLKGICNNNDSVLQPLMAVVDDKNNIQVMRGRKVLTEIIEKTDEYITKVEISPCNQYIIYGLKSGAVKKYTLRTKENVAILDVNSPVQYLNFVNPNLLIVAGKNKCLMAYRLTFNGDWKPEMMQRGNNNLGSQEILNDIQGVKKKNGHLERLSSSSSETSICSRDRAFPYGDNKSLSLCKGSGLVDCFYIKDLGIITVESNATIKLWDKNLKLLTILNGRQSDVFISSAALQNNVLVICEKKNKAFQTFELTVSEEIELHTIQEYRLNNVIVSCDLTADGNVLALGLDSGNVVVWNVRGRRQLCLLKHHKSKVHSCSFSPVPSRSNRNSMTSSPHPVQSPYHFPSPQDDDVDTEQPPLVLVTMATEIVWWNLTQVMKTQKYKIGKRSYNAMTPIGSPLESRCETPNANNNSNAASSSCNFFFGDSYLPQQCWKLIWKGKTCKQGSKRKEILACIKLSGMNAKRLSHDDKFSCFVTVDNPGHIHIMNVMRSNST